MKRRRLAGALVYCLGIAPPAAMAVDTAAAIAASPLRSETMVLRIRLNTQDKGDLFVERTPDRDFLVKVQDLKAMGFKDPQGNWVTLDGEPHISLRSMQGVNFDFQESALALDITADPRLLPSRSLGQEGQRSKGRGAVPEGSSGFFNYALTASGASAAESSVGFSGELGWRSGDYLFLSDGNTVQGADGRRKFVRLMSSVTYDDRELLRRTVVGDFFTPSRDFSTGINLGGISISKLYGLNPYFIQFPTQSVGGTVALPSDLEVYLDGQRIRTEKLQPGEFQLNDILAYGGARNVQLVLRDAFGRTQQLSYSFYFSDQPLRQGLHEYSYNLGAIRRGFGSQSDQYGPAAFTMFHRYGFSDGLTLGLRTEATKDLLNAGPLATAVLGSAGVASMALAGSSIAGRHGASALVSYNYQAKRWNLGASLRRDWREYAALGDPPTMTNRKSEGSLTASYYLPQRGTVSLSHSFLSTRNELATSPATLPQPFSALRLDGRHATTFGYGTPLVSGRATLSASLSHVKDAISPHGRNEAFVGLIVFLDKDYSVAGNFRGDKNTRAASVQLTRNQPIGEGIGFVASADRASDPTGQSLQLKLSTQYNAPAAIFRADLGRGRDSLGQSVSEHRFSLAGGVGYIDGSIGFGRPITDSFGIVKVGELPGVDVSVNGQPIGKTDARGRVLVPSLTPYFDNDVSIATQNVPLDYSIPVTVKTVSPSLHGGAVVDFSVKKIQAFSGKLKYRAGNAISSVEFQEISVQIDGKLQKFDTGRGGEFYIENLKPGTYAASVPVEGTPCLFDLVIAASSETFVELGDLECRAGP